MAEQPWRVLYVVVNHERRVAQHLTARGVDHYIPFFAADSRWTDRTVRLQRPLFPGYVFIRIAAGARLTALMVPGVVSLLGDDRHGAVEAAEVDRIRAALAEGYPLRPHSSLARGTRVQVREGLFAGVEGTVAEIQSECKVVLSVPVLESCFSLQMPISNVTVLDPAALPGQPLPACGRRSATAL